MRSTSLVFSAADPAAWLSWFSSDFGNSGTGGAPGGVNPYAGGAFGQSPPPRRSNNWLWLILGGLGVGAVLLCGCCGGFFYFGMSQVSNAMEQETAGHPAIAEHLGEIESMSMNVMATGEETDKRGGGVSVLVYDVKGSKGEGKLLGEQAAQPQPGNFFQKIDLRLPSGEEISIK